MPGIPPLSLMYRQFGFTAPANPQSYMERYFPDVYRAAEKAAP